MRRPSSHVLTKFKRFNEFSLNLILSLNQIFSVGILKIAHPTSRALPLFAELSSRVSYSGERGKRC